MLRIFKISFLVIVLAVQVYCHGRLWRPVNRSSIWRVPEFKRFNPPINYDDVSLFCGGVHQADDPGSQCGVCGDALNLPKPRANEMGGKYYKGIITGRYTTGGVMEVQVQISAAHLGFMEFRLCTNPKAGETQACFNRNLLQRADGKGSKIPVDRGATTYVTKLRLPSGVQCDHCVLQWNYRAGNDWGPCPDGTQKKGCGPQETFRGCSDITIANKIQREHLVQFFIHAIFSKSKFVY